MKKSLRCSIILLAAAICFADYPLLPQSNKIRNVIILIGDGMGIGQITAARIKSYGAYGRLHFEKMPVTGLVNTCSADRLITDSGAAGTALATGHKTNNGMIGMSPDDRVLKTILEACKENRMTTGLVVTSTISHATPAAFAAHVTDRNDEPKIAEHLLANRVNVMLGGGREFFLPKSVKGSRRRDNRDLIAEAKKAGYSVLDNKADLQKAEAGYVLGLFKMDALATDSLEPSLALMTRRAIDLLGNPDGFFLMVEGSQIDWECHRNDIEGTLKQTMLFDEAVKAALDFAAADSHTLVVVLADHETGGLGVTGGTLSGENMATGWLTKDHTPVMIPVYAFGPKAESFTGTYENTEIPRKIARAIGIAGFPAADASERRRLK